MAEDRELLLEMYRRMLTIREFENASIDLFLRGKIKGAATTYNGMEASAVGVCMALRTSDLIVSNHRGHGHSIAKGADPRLMAAELMGKASGYCKGRGGSMHVAAFETGSLGAFPIVGSGLPIAVGAALAIKMRQESRVVVPFVGEGAMNTGNFHESMNLASIWNLPMVTVIENNLYAVSTHIQDVANVDDLAVRACSYGIPGINVNGFEVLEVFKAASDAIERARQGGGPTMLITESYRFEGHYAGEPQVYRSRSEIEEFMKKDPIPHFRKQLLEIGIASQEDLDAIDDDISSEIQQAIAFAYESPEPSPDTAMDFIYA